MEYLIDPPTPVGKKSTLYDSVAWDSFGGTNQPVATVRTDLKGAIREFFVFLFGNVLRERRKRRAVSLFRADLVRLSQAFSQIKREWIHRLPLLKLTVDEQLAEELMRHPVVAYLGLSFSRDDLFRFSLSAIKTGRISPSVSGPNTAGPQHIYDLVKSLRIDLSAREAKCNSLVYQVRSELPQKYARTSLEEVDKMSGTEFEIFIGKLFAGRGFSIDQVGGSDDYGVDLLAMNGSDQIAIQCKRYKPDSAIDTETVGLLAGALVTNTYRSRARRGLLVATCRITENARRRVLPRKLSQRKFSELSHPNLRNRCSVIAG
jgi:Holliday junction resolvase